MLIKCPECGKEISDKSKQCIHCGYPIVSISNICIIKNKEYDLTEELQMILNSVGMANVIRVLRMKCNLSLQDARKLYDIINNTKKIPDNFECELVTSIPINVPMCPTCRSTDLKKISGLSKAGSVAMWGLLSQKVKKTYHCNNCGYEW